MIIPQKSIGNNQHLKTMCREKDIRIIDHQNTKTACHLNGSKLHLNLRGNEHLTNTFAEAVLNSLRKKMIMMTTITMIDKYKTSSKRSVMNVKSLKDIGKRNIAKTVICNLNIKYISQKFDALTETTTGNIEISMILEVRLEESFPKSQFLIKGLNEPYRLDQISKHGTVIPTGITCKKVCYMRDSACRWFIVENAEMFQSYVKHF